MIATKTKSSTNASITQSPKIPVLNTLKNYFTKTPPRTFKPPTPSHKTTTLIQKIKTATTLKIKKISKRINRKNKQTNNNQHHSLPYQQPYFLRPRPLTSPPSHKSIPSSDSASSSSSSFSSQNCSTISEQPNHQSNSYNSQQHPPQRILQTSPSQSPSSTTHSQPLSERLSLSDLSDYPFVTCGGIQQLLYLD